RSPDSVRTPQRPSWHRNPSNHLPELPAMMELAETAAPRALGRQTAAQWPSQPARASERWPKPELEPKPSVEPPPPGRAPPPEPERRTAESRWAVRRSAAVSPPSLASAPVQSDSGPPLPVPALREQPGSGPLTSPQAPVLESEPQP